MALSCFVPVGAAPVNDKSIQPRETVSAYLTDDSGITQIVTGHLVDIVTPKSRMSSDESSATYEFTLYSTDNKLEATGKDGSQSSTVRLTIWYSRDGSNFLLTKVSGGWTIHDSRISITGTQLYYRCESLFIDQTAYRYPSTTGGSFAYKTGFTKYVPRNAGTMGAFLTLDYMMGSTRT